MKVGIFGAGPGAFAMAAHAAEKGHNVGLCGLEAFRDNIEELQKTGTLSATGMLEGEYPLALITTAEKELLGWADLVIVVTHAGAHEHIARQCAQYLPDNRMVILCPAYVGGGWRFEKTIREDNPSITVAIAECSVLPFACRKASPTSVSVHGVKRHFLISCPEVGTTGRTMQEMFDGAVTVHHPLEAGMNETNFIIHVCVGLFNMGFLLGNKPWTFYREGLTKAIGRLIDRVDLERLVILKQLGLQGRSLHYWLQTFYGDQGLRGDSVFEQLYTFAPFATSPGPRSLDHRYFSEDVAFGLVPMRSLADQLQVPVPMTNALINMAETLCDINFSASGGVMKDIDLSRPP